MKAVLYILSLLVAVFTFGGCAGSRALTPEEQERATSHARDFLQDLNEEIILGRNEPDFLEEIGLLVSNHEVIESSRLLDEFIQQHEGGAGGVLTLALFTSDTVFARLISQDGIIYYIRANYDERENSLEITARVFDSLEVATNEALGTKQITLAYGRRMPVMLTFRPGDMQGA